MTRRNRLPWSEKPEKKSVYEFDAEELEPEWVFSRHTV